MTGGKLLKDLIVLCADKNMDHTIQGILSCPERLGIRPVGRDIREHPEHDPGCFLRAHEFLRSSVNLYGYALVIFDRDGCGDTQKTRDDLEKEVERRLSDSGWGERARTIVIDPELENWVWSDSPHVAAALGWEKREPSLQAWLVEKKFMRMGLTKPAPPKEAVEAALASVRKPRSSSIYRQLAMNVSFERCTDLAFVKLKETLRGWFGNSR